MEPMEPMEGRLGDPSCTCHGSCQWLKSKNEIIKLQSQMLERGIVMVSVLAGGGARSVKRQEEILVYSEVCNLV